MKKRKVQRELRCFIRRIAGEWRLISHQGRDGDPHLSDFHRRKRDRGRAVKRLSLRKSDVRMGSVEDYLLDCITGNFRRGNRVGAGQRQR